MTVFYDPLSSRVWELYYKYIDEIPTLKELNKSEVFMALREAIKPYCTFKPDFTKYNPITGPALIFEEFDEKELVVTAIKHIRRKT